VLPATVHAVLAARIDRLPEREKQVLQVAAVIGKEFPEPALREATGLADLDLDAALRTLVVAELVYEQALFPEREYAFKHPLTQEVAYGSQLGERRARTHAAVAQALEARHRDALDAKAAELAHHWEQAGDARNAVHWHRRAAELAGYAFMAQRVGHWEKVRALAARLPSAEERDEIGLAARVQLLVYGSRVGTSTADMATLYRDGSEIAARTRNEPARAQLLAAYGIYRVVGEGMAHEEVIADLREAARRIDAATDADLQVLLYVALSTALLQRDLRALLRFSDETIEQLMQDRVFDAVAPDALDPWGMFTQCKVTALARLGRLREAADLVQAMEERARERGAIARLFAHLSASYVHLCAGRAPEALGYARQAAAMTEGFENRSVVSAAHWYLGLALTATGDPDDAERTLAALLVRGLVPGSLEPMLIRAVAQAHLVRGDVTRALRTAEQALGLATSRGQLLNAADAQVVLARALVHTPGADPSAVEAALAGVEALIARTGDVSLLPQVREVRAELAQSRGDQSARSAHLREALRLYTAMGATGHAERIESLLQ
jgi:adenylate cyclase